MADRVLTKPQSDAAYARVGTAIVKQLQGNTCVISNKNIWYAHGLSSNTVTQANYRFLVHIVRAGQNIRFKFGNYYGINETPGPNAYTVRCSIEIGGQLVPLYFSTGRDATLQPGATAETITSGLELPAGDYYIRTYATVASAGMQWPVGFASTQVETGTSVTDKTTSGTIGAGSNFGLHPVAITGLPADGLPHPLIALIGDSITQGDQVNNDPTLSFEARALGNNFAFVNLGQGSDYASNMASSWNSQQRFGYAMDGVTHAIVLMCANDFARGDSFATMQANLLALWNRLASRGVKVYACTVTPRSTSTDSWATVANQTPNTNDAARVALNTWIRTKPAPLSGVFDTAAAVEPTLNAGVWRADGGVWAYDGTHPIAPGQTAMAGAIDTSQFTV